MEYSSLKWMFSSLILSILLVHVHSQSEKFDFTNFGATPNGKTDCKKAFESAWQKACQTPNGVVLVPAGEFMISGGDFAGPCNGETTFQMDGTLIASDDAKSDGVEYWISFDEVDRLRLVGKGVFDGNGASTWSRCADSDCGKRPANLRFHKMEGALIQGITSINSKFFHIRIQHCRNTKLQDLTITAPAESPNTDGIHVGSSDTVQILHSRIATGDDCGPGPGSQNVHISGVECGPGHGISIGSLGKYEGEEDVRDITVEKCVLKNTDNGLWIKTWAPSKSATVVSNVTYSDIEVADVENPIIIDQYYCPKGECRKNGESDVKIAGVRYVNVRESSTTETGVKVECSGKNPCEDVDFSGVDLTVDRKPTVASCSNFKGRFEQSTPSGCS